MVQFRIPPRGVFRPNNEVDPFRYYEKPLLGRLFAARLNVGLRLLDGLHFHRLLEVGYGSGLLLPTLAPLTDELYGVDREAEPPGLQTVLAQLGVRPHTLARADIQKMPFADRHFDGVVAFSILEHLRAAELRAAVAEVARVLAPGGHFLIGCPAVHRMMNLAFRAIGFANIHHHHFHGMDEILPACEPFFTLEREATLPSWLERAPRGWAPYTAVRLRRR